MLYNSSDRFNHDDVKDERNHNIYNNGRYVLMSAFDIHHPCLLACSLPCLFARLRAD